MSKNESPLSFEAAVEILQKLPPVGAENFASESHCQLRLQHLEKQLGLPVTKGLSHLQTNVRILQLEAQVNSDPEAQARMARMPTQTEAVANEYSGRRMINTRGRGIFRASAGGAPRQSPSERHAELASANEEIWRLQGILGFEQTQPKVLIKLADEKVVELTAMVAEKLDTTPAQVRAARASTEAAKTESPSAPALSQAAVVAEAGKPLSMDQQIAARRASGAVSPEIEPLRAAIAAARPGSMDREAMQARLDRITAPVTANAGGDNSAEILALESQIENMREGSMDRACAEIRLQKLKDK